MSKFLLTLATALMIGCGGGGGGGNSNDKVGDQSYVQVGAGTLTRNGSSLSGNGAIVFLKPLSAVSTGHNFQATFSLVDGGSLTLSTFTSNQLENGNSIRFLRQGTTLKVSIINGGAENDVSGSFSGIDASGELNFATDVHNNETPAHILIWAGSDFSEGAALVNTEEGGSSGNGGGTFWGFVFNQATLINAQVGAPKFEE